MKSYILTLLKVPHDMEMPNYAVGCRVIVQPGGPDPWFNRGGSAKVGACKSFVMDSSNLIYQHIFLIVCVCCVYISGINTS